MITYGLIGYPLSHSFSVQYFAEKFIQEHIPDCIYRNFPLENISDLPALLQSENLSGLNVTIPYKEAVLPYLDKIDIVAKSIGAVNCIKIYNGKLTGYNTDAYGFRKSLEGFIHGQLLKALVLGTGGSSKAVSYALNELHIPSQFVSRDRKKDCLTYSDLNENIIADHTLIINTTPEGMHPNIANAPEIPYKALTSQHYLYDLIYNPAKTTFLKLGAAHSAQTKNGFEMLELQAEKSWEIWQADEYKL